MRTSAQIILLVVLVLSFTVSTFAQEKSWNGLKLWQELTTKVLTLHRQGQYSKAAKLAEEALIIAQMTFGPNHHNVARSLNNLALVYHSQGKYAEAAPLYKLALAIAEKALGPEHPEVATTLNNLAELYRAQRKYAQAESLHNRAQAVLVTDSSASPCPEPRNCPGPNKTAYKDRYYHFCYESWVKKYPDSNMYKFGRCVQNYREDSELWVDWEGTGVNSTASPYKKGTDFMLTELPSPTGDGIWKPAKLWFGIRRNPIDTSYMDIDRSKVYAAMKKADVTKLPPLVSTVILAAPAKKTEIHVKLTSTAKPGDKGFIYKYDIGYKGPKDTFLYWDHPHIVKAFSKANLYGFLSPQEVMEKKAVLQVKQGPSYGIVPILFYDYRKRSFGQAATAVYLPSE